MVIDAVGKSSFFRCKKLLRPGGVHFSTELGFLGQNVFLSLPDSLLRGRRVGFPLPKDSREDIILFRGFSGREVPRGHRPALPPGGIRRGGQVCGIGGKKREVS